MKYIGEQGYLCLLADVLALGEDREDRTGVGTRSIFGSGLIFNLAEGFPLLTTKKMELKSISSELLWFIEGSGDERRLAEIRYGKPREEITNKNTIWTGNLTAPYWVDQQEFDGDLGRVYGVQLRNWTNQYGEKTDQLVNLIDGLKNNPTSRRHLITFWNPGELADMALPACHLMAQFYVSNDTTLNCMFTMRSSDAFLGLPYNIASYALLTHMVAKVVGLEPGMLIYSGGDVHIYNNHFDAVNEQVGREPAPLPTLKIRDWQPASIEDFKMDDFELLNYEPHTAIKAPMAV